jgi:hypothetical protein
MLYKTVDHTIEQGMLYKIFTLIEAEDAIENNHTPWNRGCCRQYSHTMGQGTLYKQFLRSRGCCTKYSHTIEKGMLYNS